MPRRIRSHQWAQRSFPGHHTQKRHRPADSSSSRAPVFRDGRAALQRAPLRSATAPPIRRRRVLRSSETDVPLYKEQVLERERGRAAARAHEAEQRAANEKADRIRARRRREREEAAAAEAERVEVGRAEGRRRAARKDWPLRERTAVRRGRAR